MGQIVIANTKAQFILIEQLGDTIWREHYTSIIGIEQVEYMLNKFQTAKVIEFQVSDGYEYYLILKNEQPVGYLSIKKDNGALFLSKLYVLQKLRGHGLGKLAMNFVKNRANALDCNKIKLTVNKYNTNSISVYEKIGFNKTGAVVMDIGNGFIMDDYTMEKEIF